MEVRDRIHPWRKGVKSLLRLIGIFELLGTYLGGRLWTPDRLCNTDLMWSGILIVTDNQGNDSMLKNIAQRPPADWMFGEMDFHNPPNSVAITSKRDKWDSGNPPLLAGKT